MPHPLRLPHGRRFRLPPDRHVAEDLRGMVVRGLEIRHLETLVLLHQDARPHSSAIRPRGVPRSAPTDAC